MDAKRSERYPWTVGLLVAVLMVAGSVFWWLDGLLPDRAWAAYQGDTNTWRMIASGWDVLPALWPVLLAGVVLGVVLGLSVSGYLLGQALSLDLAERVDALERREAQLREREAHWLATKNQQELKLVEERLQLQRQRQLMEEQQQRDEQQVLHARKLVLDAERRRHNAQATAERRKRKLDKLRQPSASMPAPES